VLKSLRVQIVVLAVVVLAAFALRFRGLSHLLPQWTYWDGYVLHNQTEYLRGELRPEGPERTLGYYPYLTALVAAELPALNAARDSDGSPWLAEARASWIRPRLASLLLSLLAVVGAWGIARYFVRPGHALLAAALTATSLLHITYSTAQRPHGAASGMAALAVWAALYLRHTGGWRGILVGALGVSLAVSALQSGFATLVAFALAWWLRKDRANLGRDLVALFVGMCMVALFVRLFYPFHFDERAGVATAVESSGQTLNLAGHTVHLSKFTGRGFWILGGSSLLFDPVVTVLALGAALAWLGTTAFRTNFGQRDRDADAWVCLGFVLPYLVVFGIYDLTFDRFGLPLVPLFAVAAAVGVERIADRLRPQLRPWLVLCTLAFPLAAAWKLGSLRAAPDTYELASRWLEERALPENSKVLLLQNFELPAVYSAESLRELPKISTLYWSQAQREHLQEGSTWPGLYVVRQRQAIVDNEGEEVTPAERVTPEWLEENGVRFVVALQASRGLRDPSTLDLVRQLRKRGKQALLLSPFGEPPKKEKGERELDLGFGVTEMGTALQVLRTQTYGPQLEIFEL
jgi:hypothetical protein